MMASGTSGWGGPSRKPGDLAGGGPLAKDSEVGAVVEIEGVTDPGGYAPCVLPVRFKRVGSGPLPEARRIPLEGLLSGSEDGQRVEVEGVVQGISPTDEFGDSKVMVMVGGSLPGRIRTRK